MKSESTTADESSRLVETIAFELFGTVQTFERWRFDAHIIFFTATIISLITTGYVVYVMTVISLISGVTAFVLRLLANRHNFLGHSLHRIAMLAKAYSMNSDQFDASYLFSKVPVKIHKNCAQKVRSVSASGEYTLPNSGDGTSQLRWMIQENAFFNATLYAACAEKAQKTLWFIIILVLLCTFLIVPLADGQGKDVLLRGVLAIFSVTILYDQAEQCANWKFASRLMLDLENELARFKTVPEHRVLLLFSNYQIVILGAPAIEEKIYQRNRDKLNFGWKHRAAALQNDWGHNDL
ncbi:hypothetical protein IQ254_03030 [Nodosilinea sp. LEGE 07088]|uniref:hypothetical protein n=1 Tax=Nodosilinea sp. LEGE 07088 TaxID=2777968 RepID=UPI001881CE09|nr:hypothetical protein [Nodosilinea sp. LEGE 07088]MBE9136184.1 hypothetical protein [Nodosilinea sp. LEGE 07088]